MIHLVIRYLWIQHLGMKLTAKQYEFANQMFELMKSNNLYDEYIQQQKKNRLLYQLIYKKELYHYRDKVINYPIICRYDIFSDELITEMKTLFKMGNVGLIGSGEIDNIQYVYCLLKKLKNKGAFIGSICGITDRVIYNCSFFSIKPKNTVHIIGIDR